MKVESLYFQIIFCGVECNINDISKLNINLEKLIIQSSNKDIEKLKR